MITAIELKPAAVERFNAWFALTARQGVSIQAVTLEALRDFEEAATRGDDMQYELAGQFTQSGRPEIFTLPAEEVVTTCEADE